MKHPFPYSPIYWADYSSGDAVTDSIPY